MQCLKEMRKEQMQTFLPYPSFHTSLDCLDYKRLGKQRVEADQILKIILQKSNCAWSNHPAIKMWIGYEVALAEYRNLAILKWIERDYKNTMPIYKVDGVVIETSYGVFKAESDNKPYWLGYCTFHDSHKSNLLRKNQEYYSKYNWNVKDDLPYIWPDKRSVL